MDKVLAIVGPTASGKSSLAIEAAKRFDGEIISCDSMQVYQGMDIGTAKIMPQEMEGIPHHLIDILPIDQPWNVKTFQTLCRQAVDDITRRGKLPILCGGTGLYLKAALYDYSFEEETESEEQKQRRTWLETKTNEQLVDLLKQRDPGALEKIHPNNRQRLLRAAEMSYGEQTKSEREQAQNHQPLYNVLLIGLRADRPVEIERINQRVEQMFAQGLPQEVEKLFSQKECRAFNSFQAIGYKEFNGWLDGTQSLDEVKEQIKIHTRQYARRQMTWFGRQMPVDWFRPEDKAAIMERIESWYGANPETLLAAVRQPGA